jgi:hypothetical protein
MAPREVPLGHRIRMPVVCEAPTQRNENCLTAADTLPPESVQQELLQIERVNHMRKVERVALRNIDMMDLRVAAAAERRATAPAGPAEPQTGDLVVIRNFAHGAMQPEWESSRYKCAGYNDTRTQMTAEESGGKRWMKNVKMSRASGCWQRMDVQLLDCCLKAMHDKDDLRTMVVIDLVESQTEADYAT